MSRQRVAERWTEADAGDQSGRVAVVTGGNSGIGFETARMLAACGMTVVLACRDLAKADQAAAQIAAGAPSAVATVRLDLASLASVRKAAAELTERYPRLDLLINNAGVMTPPYGRTEDGFETQIGTNHLGHFAFTGLVLGLLLDVPGSRVVTVSSQGHRAGRINFDDLQSERRYSRFRAYGQSKLANLLFTFELQRRLAAAGAPTIALAAHPGGARTHLGRHVPGMRQLMPTAHLTAISGRVVQNAQMGALPVLRAATDPAASGGQYYGPDRVPGLTGHPVLARSSHRAGDVVVQRQLWAESERLTGVRYPV
jgi:NAD(P)-dependent dehydrogenase (short-subunit alcohol dehydrogenase family)